VRVSQWGAIADVDVGTPANPSAMLTNAAASTKGDIEESAPCNALKM